MSPLPNTLIFSNSPLSCSRRLHSQLSTVGRGWGNTLKCPWSVAFLLIPYCSGCGASVGSAGGLLGPVCDGRKRASELGSPDHRECKLLCHPWEKYGLTKCFLLFWSACMSLGTIEIEMLTVCSVAVSMLGPLTTPEHQLNKTPSSSSLSQRMKSSLTPR